MSDFTEKLEQFAFKNIMLEADLIMLEEKDGIDIQHLDTLLETSSSVKDLIDTDLFDSSILASAKKMARFYIYYYAFENSLRKMISDRLEDLYGLDWWEQKAPERVKQNVEETRIREMETSMDIRSQNPLDYTKFGELVEIIDANWDDFSTIIRSQKAMQLVISQFQKIRNVIVHSCELGEDDIFRLKLLIKDWYRILI